MKRIFLHLLFALLIAGNAFGSSIQVGDGLQVSRGGLFDLTNPPLRASILEWLYEGDGIVPHIAEDYTAAFTRASTAWYENLSGVLTSAAVDAAVFEYSSGTYLGYRQEPQRQNKQTSYNVIGVDQDSPTKDSGSLTKGKVYRITAQDGEDFTADGAADNNVGTVFVAIGTTVTLDANDTVVEQGGTKLNSDGTDEGTFVSGLGEDAQAYRTGGAWENPLPNITCSGGQDDVSTVTVYDDSAKIPTGDRDYSNLNTSGKVLKVVAGNADVYLDYTGALSAADHAISVITRGDSASNDDITCETDNVGGTPQDLTNEYARYSETITALLNDKARITVSANDTVYLFLVQSELGSAVTSEIITQGSAVTRAVDDLQLPVADGTNFRQSEGMLFADVTFGITSTDLPTDKVGYNISVTDGRVNILYSYNSAGTIFIIRSYDGTNAPATLSGSWSQGDVAKVYARWGGSILQNGADGLSGAEATYDGAFTLGTNFRIGYGATERFWLKNVRILRVDRGATYGESITTP